MNSIQDQVLALVEWGGGSIDSASLALLVKARDLATRMSRELIAVVLSTPANDDVLSALQQRGVNEILLIEHARLVDSDPDLISSILADLVRDSQPRLFLLPHTVTGVQIACSVAGKLEVALLTNCIDLEPADGAMRATRPMFGGTRHATLLTPEAAPVIVTLQARKWALEAPEQPEPRVRRYDPAMAGDLLSRIKVLATLRPTKTGVDVTQAEILVSIGRGIGSKNNIPLYQQLAAALGGVLSCSRPLADLGWLPQEHLVGISGSTVKPRIYLACGISGAYQHIAGMQDAQTIIAISSDPSAPIFEVAHCGVLADLNSIIPALLEMAKTSPREV